MAEGKRVTIYLPDGLHEEILETAWLRRQSLSSYLADLHRAVMANYNETDNGKPFLPDPKEK